MQVNRRKKVSEVLENNSLLIMYSGKELKASADNNYPFSLDKNFFYLTNIKQPNSYLIIKKVNNKVSEYLYIDKKDESKEKWFGKKISILDAKKDSKINNVLINDNIINSIVNHLEGINHVYHDSNTTFDIVDKILGFLKESFRIEVLDIYPTLRDLRMIKDKTEINDIKEAIKITDLGLHSLIKSLKTAKFEYEAYNAFNHEIMNHGTHEFGFPSIVCSGINGTCLHYPTPFDKLDRNSLILNDVGAAYNGYSADITRTYPVSGKFNDLQKKIYEIVLNTNKTVINYIKPGLTINDLQKKAKETLYTGLKKLKLVSKKEDLSEFYYHGVSHHLGLDVHDISNRDIKLKPGMVLTVEPGLYIKKYEIGIRIEDDVLVTSKGSECLSKDIVKEIDDIEKLFKEINK